MLQSMAKTGGDAESKRSACAMVRYISSPPMFKRACCLTSLSTTLALATAAAPARADTTAVVDPAIQYQPFQGWGTSLAWWAYVVGGFPERARTDYVDKAFDPVKGIGLNVVRYN